MVNTKTAERRALAFGDVEALWAELDRIEAAQGAGVLRTTGNWTAAQGLEHCARLWRAAYDGFPEDARPPAVLKAVAKMFFKAKAVRGETAPAGMKPPAAIRRAFEVGPEIAFDEAMGNMRAQVGRTRAGERFSRESPLFGRLSHDEWLGLQLGHCQLHLGFLHLK
jgi:hypothetical protein